MRKWLPATFLLVLAATLTACPPTTVEKPVIKSFTSSVPGDKLPVGGGNVTLSWTVTGADKVNLAADPASPAPVLGADNVTATVTGVKVDTIFTLTATNSAGDTTATRKVTVAAAIPAPTITTFQVKTGAGAPGSSVNVPSTGGTVVTFNWVVTNSTALSIDNGVSAITPFAATGTKDFPVPAGTTPITFKLTATGATGSTPATSTVTVNRNADTLAPTIATTVPADNAISIQKGSNLVITFSEPMNPDTTKAAYIGNDEISATNSSLTWNGTNTVLTVTPNAPLNTALTDPTAAAKVYTYSFGAGAKDVAGNALAAPARKFTTVKDVTQTITTAAALTGEIIYTPTENDFFASDLGVGDSGTATAPNVSDTVTAGFAWKVGLGFPLAAVPAGATLTAADLKVNQFKVVGAPYGAAPALGAVKVDHINYAQATLELAKFFVYDTPNAPNADILLSTVGDISTTAPLGERTLSVLAAINADRTAVRTRSTFRLRFDRPGNANGLRDAAEFDGPNAGANAPRLVLKYQLP